VSSVSFTFTVFHFIPRKSLGSFTKSNISSSVQSSGSSSASFFFFFFFDPAACGSFVSTSSFSGLFFFLVVFDPAACGSSSSSCLRFFLDPAAGGIRPHVGLLQRRQTEKPLRRLAGLV
jgi:hypothetical protein